MLFLSKSVGLRRLQDYRLGLLSCLGHCLEMLAERDNLKTSYATFHRWRPMAGIAKSTLPTQSNLCTSTRMDQSRRQRLIDEMSLDTIFERQASPLVRSSMHV